MHRNARGAPPPVYAVSAGPDVEFSAGDAQLAATGAAYGKAPHSYLWTVLAGGAGTFDDDTALDAVFTPDDDSVHSVLKLTATDDDGRTAFDTTIVCDALLVSAGADEDETPDTALELAGSATGGATPLVYAWTQTSGPGTATFVDASDPTTDVSADEGGEYVLTLTVRDERGVSVADSMTFTIEDQATRVTSTGARRVTSTGAVRVTGV